MPGPLVPGMTALRPTTGRSEFVRVRRLRQRRFWGGDNVTRLILTSGSGMSLVKAGRADIVVSFSFRFVWGPLPSENELSTYLAARLPSHGPGEHWSDYAMWGQSSDTGDDEADDDLGLIEFCKHCETVDRRGGGDRGHWCRCGRPQGTDEPRRLLDGFAWRGNPRGWSMRYGQVCPCSLAQIAKRP